MNIAYSTVINYIDNENENKNKNKNQNDGEQSGGGWE